MIIFSQKIKSKQFSEFGSRSKTKAVCECYPNHYHNLRAENFYDDLRSRICLYFQNCFFLTAHTDSKRYTTLIIQFFEFVDAYKARKIFYRWHQVHELEGLDHRVECFKISSVSARNQGNKRKNTKVNEGK